MPFAVPPPLQAVDPDEEIRRVLELAAIREPSLRPILADATRPPGGADIVAMGVLASNTAADGVAPEDAAEQIAALLREARRTGAQDPGGGLPGGEPLGVVVGADIELIGLRDRPVLVSWEMWQQGGGTRLYGEWLNTNLAYRLEAKTDHDSTTVDLWVPLPEPPGPYFIRLLLTAEESPLASADSEPFN